MHNPTGTPTETIERYTTLLAWARQAWAALENVRAPHCGMCLMCGASCTDEHNADCPIGRCLAAAPACVKLPPDGET